VPTIVNFNALISACGKATDLQKALGLYADLQLQGILLDKVVCNALISACEKGQDLAKALYFYEALQR